MKEWRDDARRDLGREVDHLREKKEQLNAYMRSLDATDELLSKVDDLNEELAQKQCEINDLARQLEQKEADIESLRLRLQGEIDTLREELIDARMNNLSNQAKARVIEVHNYFKAGSNSQVFNDQVTGDFKNQKKKSHGRQRK